MIVDEIRVLGSGRGRRAAGYSRDLMVTGHFEFPD